MTAQDWTVPHTAKDIDGNEPGSCRMIEMYSEACGTVFIMSNGDIRLSNGEKPTAEQGKALMKEFGTK